jgi:hypothetical protein
MTVAELVALFEKHSDQEYIKYERIDAPLHKRADLAAFLLLETLAPLGRDSADLVTWAGHDEIGLGTDVKTLAANATEDDIVTLIRCGVRLNEDGDSLMMFV